MNYLSFATIFLLLPLAPQSTPPPPAPNQLEVVNIEKQPWSTAADNAVARQIVSPSNSRGYMMSLV